MDIEIAEFYPKEHRPDCETLIGSLRIRLAELGIETH